MQLAHVALHAWRRQIRPSPVYGSTDYGQASQWRIQNPYCLHVWSQRQEGEFAGFGEFRNAALCPFGMSRPPGASAVRRS